ncbi:MAG: hypothetical protein GY874_16130 [Desulfobacteraceae bacterium]|nr:hypothetical protein [Desulfobacteraceae bacterium]
MKRRRIFKANIIKGFFYAAWLSPAWAADQQTEPAATEMSDIHDIKPIVDMGTDLLWLLWVLAALAALAIAAYLVRRLWLRRKRPLAQAPGVVLPEPDQEAYQALDKLETDDGLEVKPFYFKLSSILRRYIERRFNFPAQEMTTEELLPHVNRLELSVDLAQPLKAFCHHADPIKFANAVTGQTRMNKDLGFVRSFVQQTTREPETQEQEQV